MKHYPAPKPPRSAPAEAANLREGKRVHGLLAATLGIAGSTFEVRLKNLSTTGALVEGPTAPAIGSSVTLQRFHVVIPATVVRGDGTSFGLRFNQPLDAATVDLIKVGKAAPLSARPAAPAPRRQLRAPPGGEPALGGLPLSDDALDVCIAQELEHARTLLAQIGEGFGGDHVVVQRHWRNLQNLDLVAQLIADLSQVLAAGDKDAAIGRIGTAELRSRLQGTRTSS